MRWLLALLSSAFLIAQAAAQPVIIGSLPVCNGPFDGLISDASGNMACRSYQSAFAIDDVSVPFPGFADITGRIGVSCALDPAKRNKIIIAIGQSNISSTVSETYAPTQTGIDNFNYYNGGCYKLADPVLGASARFAMGSWIGRLGDKLRQADYADRIIFATMAIDGRSVGDWATGGMASRIPVMARRLASAGLLPTNIIWTQGEQDNTYGTSAADYTARLQTVVQAFRSFGIHAPFMVSLTSRVGGPPSATVRAGQTGAVSVPLNIKLGPDTDAVLDRHDGIHFNGTGANTVADLWSATIRSQ